MDSPAPNARTPAMEDAIRSLLDHRAEGATICPSEAARAVGGEHWRRYMDAARDSAASLSERGEVEILQRGALVDLDTVRGPIRIRRRAGSTKRQS